MVISSVNDLDAGPSAAIGLKRQSLKATSARKRRGLSAFYATKSQSFNCMRDLQNNPFCKSAVVLGKPAQQSAWQQPFGSIPEDMCELHNAQPDCQLLLHADGCVSEPGSPAAQPLARHSWPGSPGEVPLDVADGWLPSQCTGTFEEQQLLLPSGFDGTSTHSILPVLEDSRWGSRGRSLSSSDSHVSSMDACDTSFEVTEDACCGLQQQPPTEGLCNALRATSLAVQQPKPATVFLHLPDCSSL
jgi:hypothetical protein